MTAKNMQVLERQPGPDSPEFPEYLLPARPNQSERVCRELVRCLREDCRMNFTTMARRTRIPVSTLHDSLKRLREHWKFQLVLVRKDEAGVETPSTELSGREASRRIGPGCCERIPSHRVVARHPDALGKVLWGYKTLVPG